MSAIVKNLFDNWIDVCPQTDMQEYVGVCAKLGDEQVAIFLVDGELYAISNHDPFSEANVLSRGIVGDLEGELVVASPIYKQHFRLRDGQCLEDETVSVKCYELRVSDGQVQVLHG